MASKILTPGRKIGMVCVVHPEFEGLRLRVSGNCVECFSDAKREYNRKRRQSDPAYQRKIKARKAARQSDSEKRSHDVDMLADWHKKNVEREKEYRRLNRDKARASGAKRKLAKKCRVPPWADLKAIREIYRRATEQGLTVDHIIPLQGKLVSGLHVENNLQLLPGPVNFAKGNRFAG